MTLYSPALPRDRPCVGEGRRRFDILTIGLHWATVTLIAGMFASAWLLLASDREHAVMLLTVHRSLGVVTWVVAIVDCDVYHDGYHRSVHAERLGSGCWLSCNGRQCSLLDEGYRSLGSLDLLVEAP